MTAPLDPKPGDRLACGHKHVENVVHAHCMTEPADVIGVTWAEGARDQPKPFVVVSVFDNANAGTSTGVHLTAADARRIAAALLNSADAIDGTTPLVFHPPGPTARPRRGRG